MEGIIQEERIEKEEEEEVEECEADDEDGGDDGSSDTSVLVVPYPELVPVVFFCLKQTTCPRSWCIRMVSSPYPSNTVITYTDTFALFFCLFRYRSEKFCLRHICCINQTRINRG